jgi:CheY-like chemotaxis protein
MQMECAALSERRRCMSRTKSYLEGMRILAVDDEEDVLDTIEEVLAFSNVDKTSDYHTAKEKIERKQYDLAILDIMGVDGLDLLKETVSKGIPTVMLTAHAMNAETLMMSIERGAISFLPKEKLADIEQLLANILEAHHEGKPTWKILFEELGEHFDEKFGLDWQEKHSDFWSKFKQTYSVGKGIRTRLMHDRKILSKGV